MRLWKPLVTNTPPNRSLICPLDLFPSSLSFWIVYWVKGGEVLITMVQSAAAAVQGKSSSITFWTMRNGSSPREIIHLVLIEGTIGRNVWLQSLRKRNCHRYDTHRTCSESDHQIWDGSKNSSIKVSNFQGWLWSDWFFHARRIPRSSDILVRSWHRSICETSTSGVAESPESSTSTMPSDVSSWTVGSLSWQEMSRINETMDYLHFPSMVRCQYRPHQVPPWNRVASAHPSHSYRQLEIVTPFIGDISNRISIHLPS